MPDSLLSKLQQAANKALTSNTKEESIKHLATAFSLFSKETHRLENAYMRLQNRFKDVNTELEKTYLELRKKITDLHSITSYLNNLLKNISQGIIFIDLDGIVTTYNPAAEKIIQKQENDLLFHKFSDVFSDDFFGFSINNALSHSLSRNLNYITINSKDIEITTSFVHDCPRSYQGIIIILRDVTELQKLQNLANRNERLKELGQMAASVAHEIRNPLGAIRGYASLLYRDLENSKHLQNMSSYILEATKSLERLVNNVLHYTRPLKLSFEPIDIVFLTKDLIKSIKVDPSFSNDIKIALHLSDSFIEIKADKHLLKAAILNLIVNAYQAMDDIGTITISIIKNQNHLSLSITDTGLGIEEKDLENIFSPFFTTKQKGNGLGLSEAYKIIQAHFGHLDVRSLKDQGTTFTINIPIKR